MRFSELSEPSVPMPPAKLRNMPLAGGRRRFCPELPEAAEESKAGLLPWGDFVRR